MIPFLKAFVNREAYLGLWPVERLDNFDHLDIISANHKGCEEDEYASYGGTESRRLVKVLPVMVVRNGPRSRRANVVGRLLPVVRDGGLPLKELGYNPR